jgi:hypothetical protein
MDINTLLPTHECTNPNNFLIARIASPLGITTYICGISSSPNTLWSGIEFTLMYSTWARRKREKREKEQHERTESNVGMMMMTAKRVREEK